MHFCCFSFNHSLSYTRFILGIILDPVLTWVSQPAYINSCPCPILNFRTLSIKDKFMKYVAYWRKKQKQNKSKYGFTINLVEVCILAALQHSATQSTALNVTCWWLKIISSRISKMKRPMQNNSQLHTYCMYKWIFSKWWRSKVIDFVIATIIGYCTELISLVIFICVKVSLVL